jgi:dihydrolipoamide dehydrogenase
MPSDSFDVLILGGGMAGYPAAIRASQLGLSVGLIEADKLGGTCLHVGCIPTKALLESSELYHKLEHRRGEFGLIAEQVGYDYERIASRRDSVVNQLWKGVQGLMRKNKIEVIQGQGQVVDPKTVTVGERRLQGGSLMVATGSYPKPLPGLEFDAQLIISSDHATLARELPETICIIGAGAVGVEFATFYSQMGVKVILLEGLDRLVPLEDEDVSKELLKQFQAADIECRLGAQVKGAGAARGGVSVQLADGEVWAHQLLVAVGRAPNSSGAGLENAGIELDQRGFIKVDEWMRTSTEGVWAVGDVVGGYLLAHAAAHEGMVAAEDIAGQRRNPMHQELVTRCTYSHPQIASVGLSEAQARERGGQVKIGRFPFLANGRALIHGEPGGFTKLVVDAESGQLLGAHIIGVEATELIAEPALAQLFQGDAWELSLNIHPHPTLSEAVGEAALAASSGAIHV